MKEVVKMWKYPSMIILTAFSAAIYVAALVPFKALPIIPGFTEIRPATLLPILFGLLFGPAGAWGSAIGNLAADFFGTYSGFGSLFGFIGNFLYAYIPYKIWCKLEFLYDCDGSPTINSGKKLIEFGIISITASSACATVIAWGLDALKMVPFAALSTIIILNNAVVSMVLGPIFLPLAYSWIKKSGLIWTNIMRKEDISVPKNSRINSRLVAFGSLGGLAAGLLLSVFAAGQAMFHPGLAAGGAGSIYTQLGVLPFLAMMMYGLSKL